MIVRELAELTQTELEHLLNRKEPQNVKEAVLPILAEVREHGDEAIKKYTKKFDNVEVGELTVTEEEIKKALNSVNPELLKHLQKAATNIQRFHEKQKQTDWQVEISEGIILGQKITPLKRVGAYIPGGKAAYPSTALMTIIPAKVAGVNQIIACTPPQPDASIHPVTLAACHIAGANQIFKAGGVQAIAAMAYGTQTIPKVDKIVGPGNTYVTTAKTLIRDECEIDFPAGPSEILIIADHTANPHHIAWDMLAQCEHDPQATAILTTTSKTLAEKVENIIQKELKNCKRANIIKQALQNSAILKTDTLDQCIQLSNHIAPEHLEINTQNPQEILEKIQHAGSIFIGEHTPVSAGDYATGTNHVLPTAGYAKTYSGLNIDHFTKKTTIQKLNKKALQQLKNTITTIAEAEGLQAHAKAIQIRFENK
jgi:histidinol dehydrogenase